MKIEIHLTDWNAVLPHSYKSAQTGAKMKDIVMEAKDLTKKYKEAVVLDHINLQLEKGKIYGFIGRNGAGINKAFGDCYSFPLLWEAFF